MSKGNIKVTNEFILYEAANKKIQKKISSILPNVSNSIKPKVSSIINNALGNSSTTQSLLNGKLKDDFGLFGNVASLAIENIIKHISENIIVNIENSKKAGSILTVSITIPTGDMKAIINVPGASYPSKGGQVDWLEWLLTRGTQVVVGDFWLFPYAKGFTRSGGNSMMAEIKSVARDPFRVDPGHAGTLDDNFITRALEPVSEEILQVAVNAIIRSL